jgi:hypothetical protein
MRAASAAPFRESRDFTLKANPADRVQIVNMLYKGSEFRALVAFSGLSELDQVDGDPVERQKRAFDQRATL